MENRASTNYAGESAEAVLYVRLKYGPVLISLLIAFPFSISFIDLLSAGSVPSFFFPREKREHSVHIRTVPLY